MRPIRWMAWLLLGSSMVVSAMSPTAFSTISARNPFRLREEVIQVKPPEAPPLPKITLTGLTTLGRRRALLKIQFPDKPLNAAKEELMVLAEGQREGDLELLELDIQAGKSEASLQGKNDGRKF